MKIIVGLGNPGIKYEHTRHNVGFDVLSLIANKLGLVLNKQKHKCMLAETIYKGEKLILAAPQTYMNLSGEAVLELKNWYKLESEDILIVYDDIDLEFADIRFRASGSAGTHNGMRNIIDLSTDDKFPRLRIGIGRPTPPYDLISWVLSSYNNKEDKESIFNTFTIARDAALAFVEGGIDSARLYLSRKRANKVNKSGDINA